MAKQYYHITDTYLRLCQTVHPKGALSILQSFTRRSHLSCGHEHSIFIDHKGIGHVWGSNLFGECGFTQTTDVVRSPHRVFLPPQVFVTTLPGLGNLQQQPIMSFAPTQIVMGVAGFSTTHLITREGKVYACGKNNNNQLGILNNTTTYIETPKPVIGLPMDNPVHSVASGDGFTLFLLKSKTSVWGVGHFQGVFNHMNAVQELGKGEITANEFILQISATFNHALCVTSQGRIFGLGKNVMVEGDVLQHWTEIPFPLHNQDYSDHILFNTDSGDELTTKIGIPIQVQTGKRHSMILTSNGAVFTLGQSACGELGLPNYDDSPLPSRVRLPQDEVAIGIAAGHSHSLILCGSGNIYSFGLDTSGQLALGTNHAFWSSCYPRLTHINHDADLDGMVIDITTRSWKRKLRRSSEGGVAGILIMPVEKVNAITTTTTTMLNSTTPTKSHHHHSNGKKKKKKNYITTDLYHPETSNQVHHQRKHESNKKPIVRVLDIACGASISAFCTRDGDLYLCGERKWCGAVRDEPNNPILQEFERGMLIVDHGYRYVVDDRERAQTV
jgi:alpha-tubulin suppressor-like RCC1 family protein